MTWFIRRMRLFWVMAGLLWGTAGASAAPMFGDAVELVQPDGTRLEVRAWGDEFYQVYETADGYTLVEDPKSRVWCYAQATLDGSELLSTGVPAGSADPAVMGLQPHARQASTVVRKLARMARETQMARETAAAQGAAATTGSACPIACPLPKTGTFRALCILIEFPDAPASCSVQDIDRLFNTSGYQEHGNPGSIREFFLDVSAGRYSYSVDVYPNWIRTVHPKAYYNDGRPDEFFREVLYEIDRRGFDFTVYNTNGDLRIDAINFLYAPPRMGQSLSPHCSNLWDLSLDGLTTATYQLTDLNTLFANVILHETGHMLFGWPDLYDTGYQSSGAGYWCMMGYDFGQEPCAYLKAKNGWADLVVLSAPQAGLAFPQGTNRVYKLPKPNYAPEYFLVEARGWSRWDTPLLWDTPVLPRSLAIWHIDENKYGNNDERRLPFDHYSASLEQADGKYELESTSNVTPTGPDGWTGNPASRVFSPESIPDSNWWWGGPSGIIIRDIQVGVDGPTFSYRRAGDCDGDGVSDAQEIAAGATDCSVNGVPDECEPDVDGDGTVDACDNCRVDANANQADEDSDGFGNVCDGCWGTIPGVPVEMGCPPSIIMDIDGDGDVDQADVTSFTMYARGPGIQITNFLDVDGDMDVDQVEFAVLQRCWSGEDVPARPDCFVIPQ